MAQQHHRLDYTEFGATDLGRATRFYREAFGWEFNDYGPGYAGIRADPGHSHPEIGGFALTDRVVAGGPLVILYSVNLTASEAAVVAAGGTVTEPPYDFPGGSRFHFRDPEGNVLAVWSTTDA